VRALGCSGLASTQVAAGLRPRGFSGSPVLVRTPSGPVVVGVLRWMQEDDDAERAVGGVVYATRVSDLTTTWPSLRTPDPVRELAGDMLAPFRAEIEDFLSAQIRGPDGELPFAGRVRELDELDSWLDDPDGSAYHLVAGPAGIGKSAVLTRWTLSLARRDGVVALIVPISIRFDLTAERDVLLALYHRLAQVHRDSADRTASTADARQGVRDYLERPAPAGQVVVA
jgi:AAA ATPase domain